MLDVTGFDGPTIILETKKMLESMEKGSVEVLVNNEVAKEKLSKYAQSAGFAVSVESLSAGYAVNIIKHTEFTQRSLQGVYAHNDPRPLVFIIKSQFFGEGDDGLGRMLMRSFLYSLTAIDQDIKALIFMNAGVFLTIDDSDVLASLQEIKKQGAEIMTCGTSLEFYGCKTRLAIGIATNMATSVDYMGMVGVKLITI